MSDAQIHAAIGEKVLHLSKLKARQNTMRFEIERAGTQITAFGSDLARNGSLQAHTKVPDFAAVMATLAEMERIGTEVATLTTELRESGVDLNALGK